MTRVLFQPLLPDQTSFYERTHDELRAWHIETAISNDPHQDLAPFAVVHFFGFTPLPLTLRCVLNALAQRKPFVITLVVAAPAPDSSPAPEMREYSHTFEQAARAFILQSAARIFVTLQAEAVALRDSFGIDASKVHHASIANSAGAYQELSSQGSRPERFTQARGDRGLAQSNVLTEFHAPGKPLESHNDPELELRALEDIATTLGTLTYRADAYYYQELTPQLERDAQRARELQAALLALGARR